MTLRADNYFHMLNKETLEIIQMSNLEKLKTRSVLTLTWALTWEVGNKKM